MSELKKGDSFLSFVWGRYKAPLCIVLVIVLCVIVYVWKLDVEGEHVNEATKSISFIFSVAVVVGNLVFAIVSLRGQWIDSFPKYMNVKFYREGKEVKEFRGCELPLVCESDARALAQQLGRTRNGGNLDLEVDYTLDSYVDMANKQVRYDISMQLQPEKKSQNPPKKEGNGSCVTVENFEAGGKVGIEIKSEVRISPEAAS